MIKAGKIGTALWIVFAAMVLRELTTFIGMIVYLVFNTDFSVDQVPYALATLTENVNIRLVFSVCSSVLWILVFGLIYHKMKPFQEEKRLENQLNARRILILLIMGIGLQFFVNSVLGLVLQIMPQAMERYTEVVNSLGMGTSMISFVYIVLIGPIGEEFLFRGVVMNTMRKHTGFVIANIVQALCFGLFHMNLIQGLYAFVLGLVLGYICKRYASVRECILLHMVINFVGCLEGYLLPEAIFEGYFGILLLLFASVVLLFLSIWFMRKEKRLEKMDRVEMEQL